MMAVPPVVITGLLFTLLLTGLFYSLWPYARRVFIQVLLLTAVGVLLGQGWSWLELPSLHLGELDLVPGLLFAAALQPLGGRLPLRLPAGLAGGPKPKI
ncbi:MAG: hypothetical protein ACR2MZ_07110 [Candidatus Dormibacter sp.]